MIVVCTTCSSAYGIAAKPEEIDSLLGEPQWAESFPCITPLCRGRMYRVRKGMGGSITNSESIPLNSFYRAINGFGMYKGKPASFDDVRKILMTGKIIEVHGMDVGQPERSIIKTLVMADGTRLHLESSAKGACVYFIERGTPSCVEVFENGPEVDVGHVHDSCSCGEEARRTVEVAVAALTGSASASRDGAEAERTSSDVPAVPETSVE